MVRVLKVSGKIYIVMVVNIKSGLRPSVLFNGEVPEQITII
jgi:hypothetical protein